MGFKEKYLKTGKYPYFIAEIGINHNGQMDLAKRMIDASKVAEADAVKFQKRNFDMLLLPGTIISEPTGYLSKDENDLPTEDKAFGTWTYPDKRLEFTDEQVLQLWEYAESKDLDFIVSPWEENSVDFLVNNNVKVIKLASIDTTNYQFCEYIAGKGIPTIISTGMCRYDQLSIAHTIFHRYNCPMMFLHCTSSYPSPLEDKNLNCIPLMKNRYNVDIGFSGHGVGFEGTLGAVALGANVVEKHVTLSKKMSGPDQAASLEFAGFAELIRLSNNIVTALGTNNKEFLKSEKVLHGVLSKRIVTNRMIKEGAVIRKEMLRTVITKKEGGLLPYRYYDVVDSVALRDLGPFHIIEEQDIEISS